MPSRGLVLGVTALLALGCTPGAPAAVAPPAPSAPGKVQPCHPSAVIAGECATKDGVAEIEGWVVAVHEGEYIVVSDDREPDSDPTLPTGSNLRVFLRSHAAFTMGQAVKLRVIPGRMMFLGDPCCEAGHWRADEAP